MLLEMLEPAWQPCDGLERAGQSVILVFHHVLLYSRGIAQTAEYVRAWIVFVFQY